MNTSLLIALYLAAIVAANLAAAHFGPWATPIIGFFAIGFDLTARCVLQEKWACRWKRNMLRLIVAGSLLTLMVNWHAWRIAIASTIAFTVSEIVDAVFYTMLRRQGYVLMARINLANFISAFLDSVLFMWIAFGVIKPGTIVAEHMAKFIGGVLWSIVLVKTIRKNYAHVH